MHFRGWNRRWISLSFILVFFRFLNVYWKIIVVCVRMIYFSTLLLLLLLLLLLFSLFTPNPCKSTFRWYLYSAHSQISLLMHGFFVHLMKKIKYFFDVTTTGDDWLFVWAYFYPASWVFCLCCSSCWSRVLAYTMHRCRPGRYPFVTSIHSHILTIHLCRNGMLRDKWKKSYMHT